MKATDIKFQKRPRFTFLQILEGLEGIAIMAVCYLTFFLKPLRDHWGMSKKAANRPLPGDELVKHPKSQFTHAIQINAPAKYVWPWIAQMGQGRGGFYSYEALENISGLNIYNADEVLPEYQDPKIGDDIPFGQGQGFPLVICEPGQAMAIENWFDLDANAVFDPKMASPEHYLHLTWLWYVEDINEHHSRFISRNRVTYSSSWKANFMFGFVMEPMVFAMDRKMCYGIKKRAEKLFQNS